MLEVDMAAVFDMEPVACAVISPELVFVAVNQAYERLAGPRDRLIGRNVFEALPGGLSGKNARHWQAALDWVPAEGVPYVMPWGRYDLQVPGRPGQYERRYWSTVDAPLLGPDGKVALIIHRIEDITAFIEQVHDVQPSGSAQPEGLLAAEIELYARSRELQEVNERLRHARAQERHAIAALEETVERQRQEVTDASHDLRNPLTGLQTRLEDALCDPDIDSRQVLNAALQDAERLSDIVADLLELARMDAGTPVSTEPVDLSRLVRDTLAARPLPACPRHPSSGPGRGARLPPSPAPPAEQPGGQRRTARPNPDRGIRHHRKRSRGPPGHRRRARYPRR
ncbi:hypothetical protein ETD83_04130 [Actinomadura soli]|uniref:histidine kinase n=1 Tax=Actinomadura soli TaxID=2508997 RepID=A0A5C4JJH0_9ACTN|nr:PAS domain-containing sensor histidine kinase [Actinomadura soli]TMR06529.1 hypothetical protein ETD83_04130 [Actinomadura soli]